MYSSV